MSEYYSNININDTIYSIITPIGEAAIGVIRISGKNTFDISKNILPILEKIKDLKSHSVYYTKIINFETGEIIDKVLITIFKAPNSYTGEDLIEISCHGNPIILKEICELYNKLGARQSAPGEFTLRAYLNGKMDLTQAEAVNDIIKAHTYFSRISALNQLEGKTHKIINDLLSKVLDVLSLIEVNIDHSDLEEFVDENIIKQKINNIIDEISNLIKTSYSGKMIRSGIKTVIIGAPNSGKSSLMNYLLKEDRVIVSDIPGTTRDIIEYEINIKGIPVRLYDTAGIRKSDDYVEIIGIEKALNLIKDSDIRIFLFDATRDITNDDIELFNITKDYYNIYVLNKIDKKIENIENIIKNKFKIDFIPISVLERKNINMIEDKIYNYYFSFGYDPRKDILINNIRHENLLKDAKSFLEEALKLFDERISLEFIATCVRKAKSSIEQIVGITNYDEILDRIFTQFCIGK